MAEVPDDLIRKIIEALRKRLPEEEANAWPAEPQPARSEVILDFYQNKKMVPLVLSRINYLEAGRNKWVARLVSVLPGEGDYELPGALKYHPAVLQQSDLLRVHKGFVINLQHFVRCGDYCHIYMYGHAILPVSRGIWTELKKRDPPAQSQLSSAE